MKRICSECGRIVYIDYPDYFYKIQGKYQCGYTCYDHALLRLSNNQYITEENYKKYVERSEKEMIAQGKNILHPLIVNYVKTED